MSSRLARICFISLYFIMAGAHALDLPADTLTAFVKTDVNFARQFHYLLGRAKVPDWVREARGIDTLARTVTFGNRTYIIMQSREPGNTRDQNLVVLFEPHTEKMWAMYEAYTTSISIIGSNTIERQWFGAPNYTQKRILLILTIEAIN